MDTITPPSASPSPRHPLHRHPRHPPHRHPRRLL